MMLAARSVQPIFDPLATIFPAGGIVRVEVSTSPSSALRFASTPGRAAGVRDSPTSCVQPINVPTVVPPILQDKTPSVVVQVYTSLSPGHGLAGSVDVPDTSSLKNTAPANENE